MIFGPLKDRRAWLPERLQRRAIFAGCMGVAMGLFAVLASWVGLPSKFRPVSDPRPLSEVLWQFPAFAALVFVLIVLLPKSFDDGLP